ncbi:UrcA family protein [Sandaracinobacter neustonicus]|uniref:UrcA family protein n=1 Tax=Sandaracinobacter neustonicus TaxID=1715348 RepID=A0A501XLT7_9SPHN|nr:UrcA family protein [Sandaracinobacter neustonicus]TPE61405.1 UrcA family protein [Sandaracinobacter neustonicus]
MKIGQTLCAFGLLATTSAASAQADVIVTQDYLKMGWEQVSTLVPYGDLNLASDKGVATLRERVKAEARKICGKSDGTAKNTANTSTCYDSVIASAEPQIVKLATDAKAR